MALLFWLAATDKKCETTMQRVTQPTEPAKRQPTASHGSPSTAALSARKDAPVRVPAPPPPHPESEELREDGYGHGV